MVTEIDREIDSILTRLTKDAREGVFESVFEGCSDIAANRFKAIGYTVKKAGNSYSIGLL